MPKTIKGLADELNVSKQPIQYHYQRIPAKNGQGVTLIGSSAERLIRGKGSKTFVGKKLQKN